VAMLDVPGVTVSQVATELGIGANVLGRWRRELRRQPAPAFVGNGRLAMRNWPSFVGS
jgi:transposase-like protein